MMYCNYWHRFTVEDSQHLHCYSEKLHKYYDFTLQYIETHYY